MFITGAIHSTSISGNFGLKLNGSVRSIRESFEVSPSFEVDLFSRLDQSDRNRSFNLTIPTHSQSQDLAGRYLPCAKWREIFITRCYSYIDVTRTSMCSYDRSVTSSQANGRCVLAVDGSLSQFISRENLECSFRHSNRAWCLQSYGKYLGTVCSK